MAASGISYGGGQGPFCREGRTHNELWSPESRMLPILLRQPLDTANSVPVGSKLRLARPCLHPGLS